MAKELMWVCGILPKEVSEKIVIICRKNNKSLALPEDVFKFPLHISLKKSFFTTDFDGVKEEIKAHISREGEIPCHIDAPEINKNMIWLPVEPIGKLKEWHISLDEILLNKYNIPIDKFDVRFSPHVSLFTKGDSGAIGEMFNRLKEQISPMDIIVRTFVIGSSAHKDEFINV